MSDGFYTESISVIIQFNWPKYNIAQSFARE